MRRFLIAAAAVCALTPPCLADSAATGFMPLHVKAPPPSSAAAPTAFYPLQKPSLFIPLRRAGGIPANNASPGATSVRPRVAAAPMSSEQAQQIISIFQASD